MFILNFNDGSSLNNLAVNGSYFVTNILFDVNSINDKLFDFSVTQSEDHPEDEFPPIELKTYRAARITHTLKKDGKTFFTITPYSDEELEKISINSKIEYIAMMNNIDLED